jgi:hypothetical protein
MPPGAQPAAEVRRALAARVPPARPGAGALEDPGDGLRTEVLDPSQVLDPPQDGEVTIVIPPAAAARAVRPDQTLALPQAEGRRTDAEGPCGVTDPVGGDLSSTRGALHSVPVDATSTRTL